MGLPSGYRLGDYEIVGVLGAGGMGEVHRARDTKLHRDVALKVLPEGFTRDPERLARFQREAEILASLSHPNIAAIHGLVEDQLIQALVLELVEGPTLHERVARGPVPIRQAVDIALQIAAALEAAHERGVIHRDLKPANIKLRPDGTVKILDFGLAKSLTAPSPTDLSSSPTQAVIASHPGSLLGTVGYMSPEQVRGQSLDRRTDLWAFGCVLYEMLTGHPLFSGNTASDVLVEVLTREPDWNRLPADTPWPIRRLLERCLAKERKERLGQMEVARWELTDALPASAQPTRRRDTGRRRSIMAGLILAGVAIAAAAVVLLPLASTQTAPLVTRSTVSVAETVYISSATGDLAITQDGRHIVYAAGTDHLYARALDQLEPHLLVRMVGVPLHPFTSPDGEWVGYFDTSRSEMMKVPIRGGTPTPVSGYQGLARGASWAVTGIVFTSDLAGGLLRVAADGGTPELVVKAPAGFGLWWPDVLPGGRAALVTMVPSVPGASPMIAAVSLETGELKRLVTGSAPRFVTSGHLVYATGNAISAIRFDPNRLTTVGEPAVIQAGVMTKDLGAADFAVSNNGTFVYIPAAASNSSGRTLMWVDRMGREEPLSPPRTFFQIALSRDGTRAATLVLEPTNHDIWIYELDPKRRRSTRLTFDPASDIAPLFTPDGQRLVFASTRDGGHYNLFWRTSDGSGTEERITTAPTTQNAQSWLPDGRQFIFWELSPTTGYDLFVTSLTDRKPRLLLQTPFNEVTASLSPDGRWLAYQSDESGQFQVYVRPFPDLQSGHWQISADGGMEPTWGADGRELFFRINQAIKSVKITTSPAFEAGPPETVLQGPYFFGGPGRKFAIAPDGLRFLVMKAGGTLPTQIILVQNWFQELAERLTSN